MLYKTFQFSLTCWAKAAVEILWEVSRLWGFCCAVAVQNQFRNVNLDFRAKQRQKVSFSIFLSPLRSSHHINIYRVKEVLTPKELKRIKISSVSLPCELTVWRKKKTKTNNRKPNCLSTVGSWYNISLNWVQLFWPLEGQYWKQFPKLFSGTWAFCHLNTNAENILRTLQIQTPGWLPILCVFPSHWKQPRPISTWEVQSPESNTCCNSLSILKDAKHVNSTHVCTVTIQPFGNTWLL